MTDRDPDADDLLAAELAFGLLDVTDRALAEQRTVDDAAFAERHRWWQLRALALLGARGETPPTSVWKAIARRMPANDDRAAWRWKVATGIAASVALALGAALVLRPGVPTPSPVTTVQVAPPRPLVAVLASADRGDVVSVQIDPATRRLTALPAALAAGGGDAELWVIGADGKPVSLGVLAASGRTRRVPSPQVAALLVPGSTLAVSLEPRGGSTTGAPTGPVILTGKIARS